jgi:putative endonuclease
VFVRQGADVRPKKYYIYIMASRSRTLYVGMTNDLERRIEQHRRGLLPGFTSRYRVSRLVYFEATENVGSAIAREKEIKGWRREKKVALIESGNPTWDDLAAEWSEGEGEANPSPPPGFARARRSG